MKKLVAKVVLLAVTVGCLGSFAGCHGAKETLAFEMPEEFDTTKNHEITFWAKNDTNRTQVDIYEKAIADFEALYPNVKVNIRLYTDYGRIYNDVITNIATNTTPNVCITYPDHIATYLTGENKVVPMDALFFDKEYGLGGTEVKFDAPTREEIIPKFLEECAFNGHYYAVPYMRSSEVCYINKTFVERLGYTLPEKLTWDFLWEVSEAAMEMERDDTFRVNRQKVMVPFIYKSTDNMMITMLKQKEAGYSTNAGEIEIFNDTTKEILYTVAEHGKTRAFSTFKISSYPANFLNAGQCIFAIDSTAGATWMGTDAPLCDIAEEKIVKFETVVMELPQFDTENPQMISQGPSMCIFNKEDPQEVLASWLFVQFMLTNEVQIAYAQTEGYVPVTSKAQTCAEYQDYLSRSGEDNELYYSVKLDATKLLLENIDNTFVTPVFNGSASLRDAAGQMIEETVKGVRRKKVVDEAFISDLFANMTSLYRLDQLEVQGGSSQGEKVLGELPKGSKILLTALAGAWGLILLYGAVQLVKSKRNEN
ncbi:MAG: extracellular solute-binding protein [Lachnospiraceae bacterium]|nr:extracellular solute-binding protein [Lachnospiraceae bacterium]